MYNGALVKEEGDNAMATSSLDVLLSNAPTDGSKKDEFSMLWDKIAKAEKSYERAEKKRKDIFDEFNAVVKPVEESLSRARYALAEHLVGFYEQNKIKSEDKETLGDWIEDIFDSLYGTPFRSEIDLDALIHRYETGGNAQDNAEAVGDLDMKKAFFSLMRSLGVGIDDEEYEQRFKGKAGADLEAAFEDFMHEALGVSKSDSQSDDFCETEDGCEYDHGYDSGEVEAPSSTASEPDSLQDMLSQLYKKVAQKIHPDKAKDEAQRQEYNQLMQTLIQARKDGDIYTILAIIRTHLDHSDVQLTEGQLDSVLNTLDMKLWHLKQQRENLKREGTIESAIYTKFNGRGKKAIRQKMDDYCLTLRRTILAYEAELHAVSSLKTLNAKLQKRKQQAQIFSFQYC